MALKVIIKSCNPLAEIHLYKMIIDLVRQKNPLAARMAVKVTAYINKRGHVK